VTTPLIDPQTLLPPSILLVDDDARIHSSIRLRLGDSYRMISAYNAKEGLKQVQTEPFDLCIVDVQMPGMDGLTFIEEARKLDPALGCVVLSGFGTPENLLRTIPLNAFDFLPKPLPDRENFDKAVPYWIDRTRAQRREQSLAKNSAALFHDLELAKIEREVEIAASETAREALFHVASTLTTLQALLLNSSVSLDPLAKSDSRAVASARSVHEARKQLSTAVSLAETYFGSAYANRDSAPAAVDACLAQAVAIARRCANPNRPVPAVDHQSVGAQFVARDLAGIDFLLLFVPLLSQVIALAPADSTVRVNAEALPRLDAVLKIARLEKMLWVNRRNATSSSPVILLSVRMNAEALEERLVNQWLRGTNHPLLPVPSRGIIGGIQKSRGLLGVAVKPRHEKFEIVVALPV